MIIIFTGNGKGKTTASLGQAMRALGRGKRVLMIQFIKGPWRSGEDDFAEKMGKVSGAFELKKMGLGFVGILGDQLPREEHEKAAAHALKYFKEQLIITDKEKTWDVIILDEINVAVSLNLLKVSDVTSILPTIPHQKLAVLTGRDAPQEFIDAADLVTEMREVKHPFVKGKLGKQVVEF